MLFYSSSNYYVVNIVFFYFFPLFLLFYTGTASVTTPADYRKFVSGRSRLFPVKPALTE